MGALRLTARQLCHPGKCSLNISAGVSFSVQNISQGDRAFMLSFSEHPLGEMLKVTLHTHVAENFRSC